MTPSPKVKLSDRVRSEVEAAPWVLDEIKKLEATVENLVAGSTPTCLCPVCGDVISLRVCDVEGLDLYVWRCANPQCIVGTEYRNLEEGIRDMSEFQKGLRTK